MPLPIASTLSFDSNQSTSAEYPATTKQATSLVDGIHTDVMILSFTDKVMITISQEGRLAQWIQVPLSSTNPSRGENYLPSSSDDILPSSYLTANTLLGGATPERETVGQLYATHIASAIATKNPDESRTILVGLGLTKAQASREQFFDLMQLVTQCL